MGFQNEQEQVRSSGPSAKSVPASVLRQSLLRQWACPLLGLFARQSAPLQLLQLYPHGKPEACTAHGGYLLRAALRAP